MKRTLLLVVALAWSGAACALVSCTEDLAVNPIDAGGGRADATIVDAANDASDAAKEAAADAACSPVDAATLDAAQVKLGLSIVQNNRCLKCHGQVLSGNKDGVPSPGFGTAYPPNLTPDPATGLGCWSPQEIANAILHGVDDEGRTLCPPMPVFAEAGLDETSVAAVVEFLRSLPPIVNQVSETTCVAVDAGPDAPTDDASDGATDGATDDASDGAADGATDAAVDASDAGADADAADGE